VHPRDEYEEVRDTLVKALPAKLLDPKTGAPVIERVYRKEELYPGEYLFCAPDLVVLFRPGYASSLPSARLDFDEGIFTTPAAGTVTLAGAHPSMHTGFLLASAASLQVGISLPEPVSLTSVVPSLLHALYVAYVDMGSMDSPAISGLFLPSYLETHPIRASVRSQELSEEDEELVINRLRDLGYV
jgi:predicted AlkP superfamily phosphohydrolase/phosphomutase